MHPRGVTRDVYAAGSAYADGLPWPGDLAFRAFYDYNLALLLGDLTKGLRQVWLFLPTAAGNRWR